MSGEIRRENFADEASWLEFQANQLELARHKRQREAAQKHAEAGRDYGVIRRINHKIKERERNRRRYWANPERWRAYNRQRKKGATYKAWYEENRARLYAYSKQWYEQNIVWARRSRLIYQLTHRAEITAKRRAWRVEKRKADPEWHEREKAKARAYRASKREKI